MSSSIRKHTFEPYYLGTQPASTNSDFQVQEREHCRRISPVEDDERSSCFWNCCCVIVWKKTTGFVARTVRSVPQNVHWCKGKKDFVPGRCQWSYLYQKVIISVTASDQIFTSRWLQFYLQVIRVHFTSHDKSCISKWWEFYRKVFKILPGNDEMCTSTWSEIYQQVMRVLPARDQTFGRKWLQFTGN
jgi:hypothetical protein